MRLTLALLLALALPLQAETIDRVGAVVERDVITVSEVGQMAAIRFYPRAAGATEDDYRRAILEELIAQALRYRDVERFAAQDIPKDSIEARVHEIAARFPSPADFDRAVAAAELTPDEVRALVKRQLQVEAYVQERYAPLVLVSSDEVDAYYRGTWSAQRRQRGLPIPPLSEVRPEIQSLLKASRLQEEVAHWTAELRARANVDVYAWK